MCQLTFYSTNHLALSRYLVGYCGLKNTLTTHKDGYGVFSNNRIFKTDNTPYNDENYLKCINKLCGRTGMLHVRKATTVYGKGKTLRIIDSHPFQETINGSVMTLAHNGTLDLKHDSKKLYKHIRDLDIIDSHVFLKVLKEGMEDNDLGIIEGLQECMKLFYGKFAFLINYKKNFYVVRGKARLFSMKIETTNNKNIMLVNTDRDTLISIKNMINLLLATLYDFSVKVKSEPEIEFLDENSAYIFDPKKYTLHPIGEVKENNAIATKKTEVGTQTRIPWKKQISRTSSQPLKEIETLVDKKLAHLIRKMNLTEVEISYLFSVLYKKSILDATAIEREDFEDNLSQLIIHSGYNKRRKVFNELLLEKTDGGTYITRSFLTMHPELEPLYFLNSPRMLNSVRNKNSCNKICR